MGHLPEAGEEAELGSFHFQVTKADARRVHQFRGARGRRVRPRAGIQLALLLFCFVNALA